MKEVYVVYGRKYASEAVFDWDDNYFGESTVFGVHEKHETAIAKFKELVKEAHKEFFENPLMMFYSDSFDEIAENSPFEDYNMDKDDYDEYELQWTYEEDGSSEICAGFQMYPVRIPADERCPILPGIYVKKIQLEE